MEAFEQNKGDKTVASSNKTGFRPLGVYLSQTVHPFVSTLKYLGIVWISVDTQFNFN